MTRQSKHRLPSGRFLLRISPELHAALRQAAEEAGTSLNDFCARKLAAPIGSFAGLQPGVEIVVRAADLFGESLVGVAAFGSWVRQELTPASDVDLLVVVEDDVALTRELYRAWNDTPLEWEGRRVEEHFVHLPEAGSRVSGLWAEVAVDGVVLFERGLELSRALAGIRREIAAGRIVRRSAHGQPYWTEVA